MLGKICQKVEVTNLRLGEQYKVQINSTTRQSRMLSVGDCAIHQKTGESGVVIGYGDEVVNNAYQTTLEVLVSNQNFQAE